MTLELEDLRNSYGSYYLALNQDYRWVDYQQNKIVPALEAVARGELKRVMFFLPPGFGKSDLGTRNFIPYWMGKHPAKNAMVLSYAASLATDDFGGKVKERLQSDLHQLLFPESKLSQDSHGKNQFRTINGGTFYSVGFGGAIAGKRVDLCFPAGTMVTTERGKIDIAKLVQMKFPPRVLSYDHKSKALVWSRIVASRRMMSDALVEIGTRSGRTLRCTQDHRIYSNGNYREARLLQSGDSLCYANLRFLPKLIQENVGRIQQAIPARPPIFLLHARTRGSALFSQISPEPMRALWQRCSWRLEILLRRMRAARRKLRSSKSFVRALWRTISPTLFREPLLFKNMRGSGAFPSDAWIGKFALQTGRLSWAVSRNASVDLRTGSWSMRSLFSENAQSAYPSHRRESQEQSAEQLDLARQWLPHDPPQIEDDTVAMVRDLCTGRVPVYDIQVEGTNNFFANEILVHNCLLDDLIKNDDEANSEIIQEKLFQTYGSVVKARLRPGGAIVFLMTRWRLRDIAGRILELEGRVENGGDWTVIKLPAEDPPGSGNYLWSDFYPPSHYEQAKKFEDSWQSLWLQDPQGSRSLWFKKDWLEFYDVCPPRDKFNNYMIIDPAMGLGKKSDRTAIFVIAAGPEQRYIIMDMVLDRLDPGERARIIISMAKRWQPKQVIYEEIGLNSDTYFIRKMMKEENHPPRLYPIPVGRHGPRHLLSKELRIKELIPIFFDHKFVFPRKFLYTNSEGKRIDLVQHFIENEYGLFKGKGSVLNDDMLDCLSRIREPELVWRHWQQVEEKTEGPRRSMAQGTTWESRY